MDGKEEEYDSYINRLRDDNPVVAVAEILRSSRFVNLYFPPSSSGAGDVAENLVNDLREYWGLPRDFSY